MIYIVQLIIIVLIISFIVFSGIEIHSKLFRKESKAFYGMVISLISFLLILKLRNHLIENELAEHLRHAGIEQKNSYFSKKELSEIHTAHEKIRTVGRDIDIVLMPENDTVYLDQDFHNRDKFWIHYKKYEFLKITAPIGYIIKN